MNQAVTTESHWSTSFRVISKKLPAHIPNWFFLWNRKLVKEYDNLNISASGTNIWKRDWPQLIFVGPAVTFVENERMDCEFIDLENN